MKINTLSWMVVVGSSMLGGAASAATPAFECPVQHTQILKCTPDLKAKPAPGTKIDKKLFKKYAEILVCNQDSDVKRGYLVTKSSKKEISLLERTFSNVIGFGNFEARNGKVDLYLSVPVVRLPVTVPLFETSVEDPSKSTSAPYSCNSR